MMNFIYTVGVKNENIHLRISILYRVHCVLMSDDDLPSVSRFY